MQFTKKKTLYNVSLITASLIIFLITYPKTYAQFFMLVALIGVAFTLASLVSPEKNKV
ncbi:hypothetical protein [Saliterribacillus persicus]|uniref:Uncharacterized protein n=1 Tax=Saliterribacillus persicus TaxID=930114 RepID=A0A368X7F1_9BACI|nr:hypothetical protein [Saliterribacillus persicus]RCW63930.1 hypothetical protein DFR57_11555 [Saliterribacillus persicus]